MPEIPPRRLATPSAVRTLLARYGLHPRKAWGQNFLVDPNVARKVVAAAQLAPADAVLEIGPGLGALTGLLAGQARHVLAVERDPGLVRALRDLLGFLPALEVLEGDVLGYGLAALAGRLRPGEGGARKLVGNLPYGISSPVLLGLLEPGPCLERAVVMVQKEVAGRLLAAPGTRAYGALTVAVQARAVVEWVAAVPPTVFWPRPEVESAVVRLRPRPGAALPALFEPVVRAAFGKRRKTLRNALKTAAGRPWPAGGVGRALAQAGIDGERRGETLTAEEFRRLAAALAGGGDEGGPA